MKAGEVVQRYFVSDENLSGNTITIKGDDVHHISKVMRMTPGATILCVSESGKTAVTKIQEITNETVSGTVIEWIDEKKELPLKVAIASGLPKGDKLEYIVQKGTELGAHEFIPFIASRSIVKWDEKKSSKKIERLQKIAKEAAEQSHRVVIPTVCAPYKIRELISYAQKFDHKIVAYEEDAKAGESSTLAKIFTLANAGESIVFVFGPEGGFTPDEIEQLKDHGFISCGLGPRILRTETAPMYALAAVSYHFELLR